MATTSEVLHQQITDFCARFLANEANAEAKAAELIAGTDFTKETMHFFLPGALTKTGQDVRWALDTPPGLYIKPDYDPITSNPA
jgi:hypothetical protein